MEALREECCSNAPLGGGGSYKKSEGEGGPEHISSAPTMTHRIGEIRLCTGTTGKGLGGFPIPGPLCERGEAIAQIENYSGQFKDRNAVHTSEFSPQTRLGWGRGGSVEEDRVKSN